jgi:hypothetical protein
MLKLLTKYYYINSIYILHLEFAVWFIDDGELINVMVESLSLSLGFGFLYCTVLKL